MRAPTIFRRGGRTDQRRPEVGLVYDNTVYMDNEVPEGQALVKVGKKLRK